MKRVHDMIYSKGSHRIQQQPATTPPDTIPVTTISNTERELVSQWNSHSLQLVSGDATVQCSIPNVVAASEPNWQVVRRNWSPMEIFFNIIDSDFLHSFMGVINNNFTDKISNWITLGSHAHNTENRIVLHKHRMDN